MRAQPYHKSAWFRAERLLEQTVAVAVNAGAAVLPPASELARTARVSKGTMLRVLAAFSRNNQLTTVPRKGTFLAGAASGLRSIPAGTGPSPRERVPADTDLHTRLMADIVAHRFGPGARLPVYKELAAMYGACYRTLKRTLTGMVAQGVLVRHGKGFSIPQLSAGRQGTTIVCVAVTDSMPTLSSMSPRAGEFWRHFEGECQRVSTRLQVYDYSRAIGASAWPDGSKLTLVERDDAGNVLGYVIWTFGLSIRDVTRLFDCLVTTGKPVSIVHPNPDYLPQELWPIIRRYRPAQVLTSAVTATCG
jgi:DNA-binding transcriptional regulator YhcF (GntR family)